MPDETIVIYNNTCPICAREIDMYRARSDAAQTGMTFRPIDSAAAQSIGLSQHDAARRLHVLENGKLLKGVDAFVLLWRKTPGFAWLARLVSLPVIRPLAHLVYEGLLAPILFAMHRRRQARR